jgi:hypothetical protein
LTGVDAFQRRDGARGRHQRAQPRQRHEQRGRAGGGEQTTRNSAQQSAGDDDEPEEQRELTAAPARDRGEHRHDDEIAYELERDLRRAAAP